MAGVRQLLQGGNMIPMGIRAAKVKTARTGMSLQTSASAMQQMQTGMGASQLSSARKSARGSMLFASNRSVWGCSTRDFCHRTRTPENKSRRTPP